MGNDGQTSQVHEDDASVIAAFTRQQGVPAEVFLDLVMHAVANHIRSGKPLTMPLSIGPQSMQCLACPFFQQLPAVLPANVVAFK